MDLHRAFKIFNLDENASPSEIKQVYRKLASLWHPDRHTQDPHLHHETSEKMKELNAAYDCICSYFLQKDKDGASTEAETSGYEEQVILTCQNCGTRNRIRVYDHGFIIRCGKCGYILFTQQDTCEPNDWEKRTLCGDGECIGIIGPDGRCTRCGKTIEEGKKADEYKTKLWEQVRRQHHAKTKKRKKVFYILGSAGLAIFILITILMYSRSIPSRPSSALDSSRPSPVSMKPASRLNALLYPAAANSVQDIASYDAYFTKQFFKEIAIDKESIASLQLNLSILGYHLGHADGVVGKKTLTALRQFSVDFRVTPKDYSASDLLTATAYHAAIAAIHADWRTIVKSGELGRWISEQTPSFIREIEKVLDADDPFKIVNLLRYYKFEKERPPPLPLPGNGICRQHFLVGVAPLRIMTRDANQHHYIKLVSASDKHELTTAFVKAGTTLDIEVPLGGYELRYAVGETWYGEKFLFGPRTIFCKADKVFEFKQVGDKVSGYTVELFLQLQGNLRTQEISAFDF